MDKDRLKELERAAFTLPLSARLWTAGEIHFDAGNLELAAEAFKNLVEHQPDHRAGLYNLGVCYFRLGRLPQARSAFEAAYPFHENPDPIVKALAATALAVGEIDKAREYCQELACAELEYNVALALHLTGRTGEAVEHYRRAIEYAPALVEAYVNLGHALTESGLPFEAAEAWKKAVELKPELSGKSEALDPARSK